MAAPSTDRKLLPEDFVRRFPPENQYLVGVSGGRDSVALLHALSGRGYGKVVVCHLDHALRGRASTADMRFVEKLARTAGFAFVAAAREHSSARKGDEAVSGNNRAKRRVTSFSRRLRGGAVAARFSSGIMPTISSKFS